MINIEKDGLTQQIMALLANVSPSAVSRFITSNQITNIQSEGQRNLRYQIDRSRKIISSLADKKEKIQVFKIKRFLKNKKR